MADEPSMLDSIIAQISAMRNRLPAILTGENLDNRTEVLAQTPLNPPEDIHDQTTSEDEGDALVNELEDLPDTTTSKDNNGASVTESEDTLTLSDISVQDMVPIPVPDTESDAASQTTLEESWIPIIPDLTEPFAEVVVEGRSFLISKHLLCSRSPVLERALCGSFREARENKIDLEERLDLFNIFHKWLYQPRSEYTLNFVEESFAPSTTKEQRQLAYLEIYFFADRLQIHTLGDTALAHLDKVIRPEGYPGRASVATICQAYQSLFESCGLWKYLVAIERDASRCGMPCRPAEDFDNLPGPFIFEMLKIAEEDRKPYLQIGNKPVDLIALKNRVSNKGGYLQVEQRRKWGLICVEMGLSLKYSHQSSSQLRYIYRGWIAAFDSKLTRQERLPLKKLCARPIAERFYQSDTTPNVGGVVAIQNRD
ncbi:hypothetical protein E4T50_06192 [Aureobasidium sp. EXF-12298]|nr:hypothetical protein E4T50_06192 [Aureobasidium sp. EXF-12298]KAI4759428.1 hypothetical protein E4T51_07544 [Aureobasidium sp. EXF-12344]KAI4777459.1 hypothetical protein E4T52_07602 [Aureobasidium sp. EXF-3400]